MKKFSEYFLNGFLDAYDELEQKADFLWALLKPIRNELKFGTLESIFKDCLGGIVMVDIVGGTEDIELSLHEENNPRYMVHWSLILNDQ